MRDGLFPAADRAWDYLADTVMGGVSTGAATRETVGSRTVLHLSGEVSTANRGGFVQMRTALPDGLPDAARGLVLRLRGNGERYFVHLRGRATLLPWQFWQSPFETGPDWAVVRLAWGDFSAKGCFIPGRLAPETIRSIGLAAYGRDHVADLWLSDLGWW